MWLLTVPEFTYFFFFIFFFGFTTCRKKQVPDKERSQAVRPGLLELLMTPEYGSIPSKQNVGCEDGGGGGESRGGGSGEVF